MSNIVLYLHAHQPYRVRHYTIFDAGKSSDYFTAPVGSRESNRDIINKVSEKSYLPTNKVLLHLLTTVPEFKLSLSITGTLLEQLRDHRPDVLASFKALVDTGKVEIVGETYYHSLAFFHDRQEFERQVEAHSQICEELLNYKPHSFRNTELAYNNELGSWCDSKGYEAVITEGWDPVLGWRSPNHMYRPLNATKTKLLVKNYHLSDDIAFRFGNQTWSEWPMSADKFTYWIHEGSPDAD
ncbi:alpha-amylase, partial [Candidatus Saccharibacteria bacterium]|nr:alpha-amylase [Candidatus Saccharibacteria bacterium]